MSQDDNEITQIKIGLSEVYSLVQVLLDNVRTIRARVASVLDDERAWLETEHAKWMDLRQLEIQTQQAKLSVQLSDANAIEKHIVERRDTEKARRAAAEAEAAYWKEKAR